MSTSVVSGDALGRLALGRIANTMRQQPASTMGERKQQAINLQQFIFQEQFEPCFVIN